VPAEIAGQRPLLERAAAGDREAFALVYDDQVEGVYRYLLAWTGNRIEAAELTSQVFHSASGWLPTTNGAEGEAAAWLIAMSRDALTAHPGPPGPTGPPGDVTAAVERLPDPEREVVVLRLLLGHSLDHTAHLSGYSHRAVLELQLAACLAIHELTTGSGGGPGSPTAGPGSHAGPGSLAAGTGVTEAASAPSAEEFERRLARWEIDLTGADPALADALAAAGSLRQAIPGNVVAPTHEFVQHLRIELVTGRPAPATTAGAGAAAVAGAGAAPGAQGVVDSRGHHPFGSATFPHRGPQQPAVAGSRAPTLSERLEAAGSDPFPAVELPEDESSAATPAEKARAGGSRGGSGFGGWLARRPWVATGVATAGIVLVLGLQAFGGEGGPRECAGRPCPASTTAAVAAGEGDGSRIGTPLTTLVRSTTTTTVDAGPAGVAQTVAPPTSAVTAPPTTRPATTAAPATSASRPTTTTRAPTATAPTTTLPTTTTTAAPAPP
jgi:DNA-directed RNA polymerase specialized sigma24 family protein